MAFMDWLLGQNPSDVAVSPELQNLMRRRRGLSEQYQRAATGTEPTAGERAILSAGQRSQEQVAQQAQSRAAGARGFGRVIADLMAQNAATQAAQGIAGQTAEAAGRQRSADVAEARRGQLAALGEEERAQATIEEEQRRRARPGLLGPLGVLAGAGLGYLAGAPAQGAQLGGTLGQAMTRRQ